jgi:hypothetical protein
MLAEGCLDGCKDAEGTAEITEGTFEEIWLEARHCFESAGGPAEGEGTL